MTSAGDLLEQLQACSPCGGFFLALNRFAEDRSVLTPKSAAKRVLVRLCGSIGATLFYRGLQRVNAQSQRWRGFAAQPEVA